MANPSLFQTLPLHVVESVVSYIAGSPWSSVFQGEHTDKEIDTYNDKRRRAVMPLLWICRNFRAVIYADFCSDFTLAMDMASNRVSALRSSWPLHLRRVGYPTHLLGKELVLRLDQWTIFSGQMLKAFLSSHCRALSFPNAQFLTLDFIPGNIHSPSKANASTLEPNVTAFVELLWRIVPELAEIRIAGQFFRGNVRKTDKSHLIDTILQLHQYYNRIAQKSNLADGFTRILNSKITDLVHLECRFNDCSASHARFAETNHGLLLQLARRSSTTLQFLFVHVVKANDIHDIIRESGRGYIEYPCLLTLKLYPQPKPPTTRVRRKHAPPEPSLNFTHCMAVPGTTLFPGLRTLCIGIDYPFCDDTLFRGNAAMLERLELILYSATIDAIRKYAVFTPESHPKLKLVSIDLSPDPRVDLFSSFQEQIQFVLSIAPCATVRRVDGQILARLLPLFADFTSIRVLSLPEMVVNFWDMIAVIKSLPLLSDLRTSFPILGPEHRDIKPNELPSYVAKTFGTISWRFCRWCFCDLDNSVAVAKCVLLLALTCPNFEHINPEHYDDDDFMCAMRELCRTPGFKPFAARLRSLTSK